MPSPSFDELVGAIYDAALDSEQWYEVARLLGESFKSPASGLFIQNRWSQTLLRAPMVGIEEACLASYAEHYSATNPWANAGLFRPDLILTEASIDRHRGRPGTYQETEFYNDWVKPQGLFYSMGGTVRTYGPETVNFTFFRPADVGPYEAEEFQLFEALKPHIGRAVDIGERIEGLNDQLRAQWDLIEMLPFGIILLDVGQRVVHANEAAQRHMGPNGPLRVAEGRLTALGRRMDEHLQQALSRLTHRAEGQSAGGSFAMTVSTPSRRTGVSVTGVALSPDCRFFEPNATTCALFLFSPEGPAPLSREALEKRFGLTRTEARLTAQLAKGGGLKEASRAIGVSYETARGYLKTILQKTETHRQQELLWVLLSDWALFIPPGRGRQE